MAESKRGRLEDVVIDRAGNAQPAASIYVFALGTANTSTNPPTGTAVTLYTTATGVGTTLNPIATDSGGIFRVWVDDTGDYDVVAVVGTTVQPAQAITATAVSRGRTINITDKPPEVWLSRTTVRPSASDTTDISYRGTFDYPYASLAQILTDFGTTPMKVRICPGPPVVASGAGDWGYETSVTWPPVTTTWTGQVFNLGSATTALKRGWTIEGPAPSSAEDGIYYALFYASVATDTTTWDNNGVFNFTGTDTSAGDQTTLRNIAVTNINDTGIGLFMGKGYSRANLDNVEVWGCGSHGMWMSRNNLDQHKAEQCSIRFNGLGSGGGSGLYIDLASSFTVPNTVEFRRCRFKKNKDWNVNLVNPFPSSSGYNNTFYKCSIGSNTAAHGGDGGGMRLRGATGTQVLNCYFETGGSGLRRPFVEIDSSSGDDTYGPDDWSRNVVISGGYMHGADLDNPTWGTNYPVAAGRHVSILRATGCVVRDVAHRGPEGSNSYPYVYLDKFNTRWNRVYLYDLLNNNNVYWPAMGSDSKEAVEPGNPTNHIEVANPYL